MFKQRSKRSAVSQVNSSEVKQCSECSMISQFNSSEQRSEKRSEHSHKIYFSMAFVRTV